MPEAYLLVEHYETARPGLLVLDADGRRVDSIPLPGMGAPGIAPEEIARRLRAARNAPAFELWEFAAEGPEAPVEKLRAALAAREGVAAVTRDGSTFRVKAAAGALDPAQLRGDGVAVTLKEPVVVRFAPDADGAAVAGLAGTWRTARTPELHAFVTRLLLRPAALAAAGVPDVEAREYDLPDVPTNATGCRVARAPLGVPGVLAIHADVFHERQVVVARRGEVAWDDVLESFAKAGCRARMR